MKELAVQQVHIQDDFWSPRLEMNAQDAIVHQWEQLIKSNCIENFRLVAEGKEGFREGWFFADSDAYKWLDAACRVYATRPSETLRELIDGLIDLIRATQTDDGYIYTYNQIHFPECRWMNLQIEHELYCHGHLIEAGVSHYQATGQRDLLDIVEKAADMLVRDFGDAGPERTPGHEEIEIALIKLYHATQNEAYLALAQRFIEQRGRSSNFAGVIFRENRSADRRSRQRDEQREGYLQAHPEYAAFRMPAGNVSQKPPGIGLRFFLSALSGKYFQQHCPVREQTIPVGHAVRFAYLETAVAMLYRVCGDATFLSTLEKAWERMVNRRMYVTGGIGSLPVIEGFGRDYELDPEIAYAETCAALGCMFWNWEMALSTCQAKYADLFEWQLYNAASVGIGLEGKSYLYNNPLASKGGMARQEWFNVPCCPPNVSRTWAYLGKYLYSYEGGELWIHQYVGNTTQVDLGVPVRIEMDSELPWRGKVTIRIDPESPADFAIRLRVPSWAGSYTLKVNTVMQRPDVRSGEQGAIESTASGYAPDRSTYVRLARTWSAGDIVELEFPMRIDVLRPHPKVRSSKGRVTLTRGPLVYCVESVDNPDVDVFDVTADLSTLRAEFSQAHLGGVWVIRGNDTDGTPFTAIPYYCWANRGKAQMTVIIKVQG
jgi:DUF1680 family protein